MKRVNNEQALYLIIILLALIIRCVYLGAAPLSNDEAKWALDAYHISQGNIKDINSNPLYILWTGSLFFLFKDSNFLARLLGALSGTALVGLPYFLRSWLGKKPALILALGLALDPSLMAASRLAGGPMLSICFIYFALAFWFANRKNASIMLFAISLLTGSQSLHGLLGILIAFGVIWVFKRLGWVSLQSQDRRGENKAKSQESYKPSFFSLLLMGGVFLALGTFFLRFPAGIAAFGKTFSDYLFSWSGNGDLFPLQMFVFFLVNEGLAVCAGGLGLIRAWWQRNNLQRILGIISITLLLWLMIYPQRELIHLAWVALPLWTLAAYEIASWENRYFYDDKQAALAHTALVLLLMFLGWINLASLTLPQPNEEVLQTRWILLMGVTALAVLSTLLVGLGWSVQAAKFGLLTGISLGLSFYMIGTVNALVFPHPIGEGASYSSYGVYEQWTIDPSSKQMGLMLKTLEDIAEWKNGNRSVLDIAVVNPNLNCLYCPMPPAIEWALRKFNDVSYLPQLSKEIEENVILASLKQPTLNLVSAYRGQSFALFTYPDWRQMSLAAWINYIVHREVPVNQEQFILWVKNQVLLKLPNE